MEPAWPQGQERRKRHPDFCAASGLETQAGGSEAHQQTEEERRSASSRSRACVLSSGFPWRANCKVHHPDAPKPEDVEKQRTQERKRIEAQKVEITIRHQVFAQVLQKVPAPLAKAELELIAMRLLDKLDYQRRVLIAKRHKLISGKNAENDHNEMVSGFKKMFRESDDKGVCRLLLECLLIDSAYHVPTGGDDLLLSTAKRYRIDTEKVARQVRDDLATKAKKKAAQAKKASKAAA
jgi:hypothetical protein